MAGHDSGRQQGTVAQSLFRDFLQGRHLDENGFRTFYQMQGSVEVESTLGVGTTFTFRLPFLIDKEKHQILKKDLLPEGKELSGEKVLLVEDNEINMEIAEFYLTEHGAAVEKAWNGKEAIEKFQASAKGEFAVILMDVMMPVMDGIQAAKAIRTLNHPDAQKASFFYKTVYKRGLIWHQKQRKK